MDLKLSRAHASFLQQLSLFGDLRIEELTALMRAARPFERRVGERLFAEGDPADGMYIVERGEVSVTVKGDRPDPVMLALLGNGSIIGEMSLLDGGTRSATVEATAQTNGFWFSRHRFLELRRQRDVAAYKVLRAIARELESRRRATVQRLGSLIDASDGASAASSPAVKEMIARLYKA